MFMGPSCLKYTAPIPLEDARVELEEILTSHGGNPQPSKAGKTLATYEFNQGRGDVHVLIEQSSTPGRTEVFVTFTGTTSTSEVYDRVFDLRDKYCGR